MTCASASCVGGRTGVGDASQGPHQEPRFQCLPCRVRPCKCVARPPTLHPPLSCLPCFPVARISTDHSVRPCQAHSDTKSTTCSHALILSCLRTSTCNSSCTRRTRERRSCSSSAMRSSRARAKLRKGFSTLFPGTVGTTEASTPEHVCSCQGRRV